MRVLDLEFLGDFAARFGTEDLFAGDPAVFVDEVEPASYDLKTEAGLEAVK